MNKFNIVSDFNKQVVKVVSEKNRNGICGVGLRRAAS